MREIKFRAWDNKEKKMFIPILYSYYDGYLTCITENKKTMQSNVTEHLDETWYKEGREAVYSNGISDIKLMQFTGLHDKNGKDIYEKDIVKTDDGNWLIDWDEDGDLVDGSVPEEWMYGYKFPHPAYDGKTMEVIGNVWENPELLN